MHNSGDVQMGDGLGSEHAAQGGSLKGLCMYVGGTYVNLLGGPREEARQSASPQSITHQVDDGAAGALPNSRRAHADATGVHLAPALLLHHRQTPQLTRLSGRSPEQAPLHHVMGEARLTEAQLS